MDVKTCISILTKELKCSENIREKKCTACSIKCPNLVPHNLLIEARATVIDILKTMEAMDDDGK